MNYFAHAAIASWCGGNEAFVLGSMLPDLLPMAGLNGPNAYHDCSVEEGHLFHLATDAVFHATQTFVGLNRSVLRNLRQRGVSRGPARACAHIGVEMMIDAELARNDGFLAAYERALSSALSAPHLLAPILPTDLTQAQHLCEHLYERGGDVFETSAERFTLRLGRTLASRPRLSPTPEELEIISGYLSLRTDISRHVPALLDELSPLQAHRKSAPV